MTDLKVLTTIDEIFTVLRGPTRVAEMTGHKWVSTVSNWKRDGLPCKTFFVIQTGLVEEGSVAAPDLWNIPIPDGWRVFLAKEPIEDTAIPAVFHEITSQTSP